MPDETKNKRDVEPADKRDREDHNEKRGGQEDVPNAPAPMKTTEPPDPPEKSE